MLGAAQYPCTQQRNALSITVHSKAFVRNFAFAQYIDNGVRLRHINDPIFESQTVPNHPTTPLLLCRSRVARDNQVRDEMTQFCVTRACARAPSVDLTDQYRARRIQPQNWATFSPQGVQLFHFNHMLASRCYVQGCNLRLLKMPKTIFSSKPRLNVYNLGCFLHIHKNQPPPNPNTAVRAKQLQISRKIMYEKVDRHIARV